ncbi:MAG: hypothetical protein KBH93_11365 [Anaerolineae bacterium]|nr:hypothetical protein [Anaerolineae bacterium]
MKVLALEIETPGSTAEQFGPHLKAEARRVWELYQVRAKPVRQCGCTP